MAWLCEVIQACSFLVESEVWTVLVPLHLFEVSISHSNAKEGSTCWGSLFRSFTWIWGKSLVVASKEKEFG